MRESSVFHTTADIDRGVESLDDAIVASMASAVPRFRTSSCNLPRWIRLLIKDKNRYRRFVQNPRNETREIWSNLNQLQKREHLAVTDFNNSVNQNRLRDLRPHNNNIYSHINRLSMSRVSNPLNELTGVIAYTSTDKADCLTSHFATVHAQKNDMGSSSHASEVESTVNDLVATESDDRLSTDEVEITNLIWKVKNCKSPEFVSVRNIALKNISQVAIVFLTWMVNAMFSLQYFPERWKTAKVLPLARVMTDAQLFLHPYEELMR